MLFTSMQTDHCIIVVIVLCSTSPLSLSLALSVVVVCYVSDDFVASSSVVDALFTFDLAKHKKILIVIFLCQHAVFRLFFFCLFIHSD